MKKDKEQSHKSELRERAEEFLNKGPSAMKKVPPKDVKSLIEELQIHQVELEMQNEELRESQMALEEVRDRYANLYDFAPVGYFTISEEELVLESNLTGAAMLGVERRKLTGQPFSRFITGDTEDTFYFHRGKLLETKEKQTCELKLKKKDGSEFHAQLDSRFVDDSAADFGQFRTVVSNIDDRKHAEEQLRESLKEKEVLLQEIHHRVKNNMQIVSSLLNLQSQYVKDKESLEMFKESRDRILSMASIHEKLYQSKDLARINFDDYIRSITKHLFRAYVVDPNAVRMNVNCSDVFLDINKAVPCGLIINELISNALKHAFPEGRKGEVTIDFHPDADNRLTLAVSDNGVGFPEDIDISDSETLGLRLISILVTQLKGTLEVERDGGTIFKITFAA